MEKYISFTSKKVLEMNEEEKKGIELLENIRNNSWTTKYIMSSDSKNAEVLLNLIEKLQKENEKYKRLSEMNLKNAEEFKNNMCEHRCLLKSENEELQKENEELKRLHIQDNKHLDFIMQHCIPVQKVKDKIEELKRLEFNNDLVTQSTANLTTICILQELLEGRK